MSKIDSHEQEDPIFVTERELASRISISMSTLRKRRYAGLPPQYYRVGGRIVYKLSDVVEYIDSTVTAATKRDYLM